MTFEAQSDPPFQIPSNALILQLVLTFAITWGIASAFIFFPDTATALFGELGGGHPLYFVATWSPALAGFTVVVYYAGWSGARQLLRRVMIWRLPLTWALLILLGIPLIFILGSLIKSGPFLAIGSGAELPAVLGLALMMLFLGPVEEFGWRGVVQPILQRYMAPIWAGSIIGAIWGVWHLPAFYLASTVYGDWNFLPFFIGNVTLAILVTPIFNAGKGGLFWPILFHWQLILPIWPDAQPWDTWILVGLAALVAGLFPGRMFDRTQAVTRVISVN